MVVEEAMLLCSLKSMKMVAKSAKSRVSLSTEHVLKFVVSQNRTGKGGDNDQLFLNERLMSNEGRFISSDT